MTQDKKESKCEICQKSFATKQSLQKHVESIHYENNGDFECKFCNKEFSEKGNLKVHTETVHWSEITSM